MSFLSLESKVSLDVVFGNLEIQGKQNSLFRKGPVIKLFVTVAKQIKKKGAEIPVTTSGHLQLHALIMCNSGQFLLGNSELFPILRHSFCNVAACGIWR